MFVYFMASNKQKCTTVVNFNLFKVYEVAC
jgi:hypothetical protein